MKHAYLRFPVNRPFTVEEDAMRFLVSVGFCAKELNHGRFEVWLPAHKIQKSEKELELDARLAKLGLLKEIE